MGGLAALILDAQDQNILRFFGSDVLLGGRYQEIDKLLDLYYLSFEFLVSLKWTDKLARAASKWLFFLRVLGIAMFEITGLGFILLIFPNIFEYFYLFYIFTKNSIPNFKLTAKKLALILILLGIPKLWHEYILHVSQDFRFYDSFKLWVIDLFR